ncbi:MAG: hypothetical protein IJT97_04750 [Bacteroidaceae bacterium]|nr:hypothetical protein [Bacteroidaceae bacterium]
MKKVYIKPVMAVTEIQQAHIVCDSPKAYNTVSSKPSYSKERGSEGSDSFDELW